MQAKQAQRGEHSLLLTIKDSLIGKDVLQTGSGQQRDDVEIAVTAKCVFALRARTSLIDNQLLDMSWKPLGLK